MRVKDFTDALLAMDRVAVQQMIANLENDNDPFDFIEEMIVPALEIIGKGWENGDVALSQVYMSGRIIEDMVEEILPTNDPKRKNQPKMAIAVLEDYHLLGKRIILSMLRASGFSLLDFGRVTVEELYEMTKKENIKILLISTLMLQSALRVEQVKECFDRDGLDVKIIVGGAPFRLDKNLYRDVNADGTAADVKSTLMLVESLVSDV